MDKQQLLEEIRRLPPPDQLDILRELSASILKRTPPTGFLAVETPPDDNAVRDLYVEYLIEKYGR